MRLKEWYDTISVTTADLYHHPCLFLMVFEKRHRAADEVKICGDSQVPVSARKRSKVVLGS